MSWSSNPGNFRFSINIYNRKTKKTLGQIHSLDGTGYGHQPEKYMLPNFPTQGQIILHERCWMRRWWKGRWWSGQHDRR